VRISPTADLKQNRESAGLFPTETAPAE